jgi:hypothetical protein
LGGLLLFGAGDVVLETFQLPIRLVELGVKGSWTTVRRQETRQGKGRGAGPLVIRFPLPPAAAAAVPATHEVAEYEHFLEKKCDGFLHMISDCMCFKHFTIAPTCVTAISNSSALSSLCAPSISSSQNAILKCIVVEFHTIAANAAIGSLTSTWFRAGVSAAVQL